MREVPLQWLQFPKMNCLEACSLRRNDSDKTGSGDSIPRQRAREREFFIDNLLVRIHLIMSQMFLVDRPRAMGV